MRADEPTVEALINGAVAVFEQTSKTKITNRKGFIFFLLGATAGLAKICLKYARILFKNNFVHLANEEGLLLLAQEYGVKRHKARSAEIEIEISNINVDSIPVSTTFFKDNLKFSSTETAYVLENKTISKAICTDSKFIEGLKVEDEMYLEQVFAIEQKAKIVKILDNGADEESLESLRKRILDIKRNAGPTGTQPYYIRNTLKIEGVQEALVFRGPELAQVAVFPVMQGFLPPTEEEKKRILAILRNPEIAIIGDYLTIGVFEKVKVKITISNLSPSTIPIKNKIKKLIESFLNTRKPLQHPLEKLKNNTIPVLDIYQLISQAGSSNANIIMTVNGEETILYTLKSPSVDGFHIPAEKAVLEELTFV